MLSTGGGVFAETVTEKTRIEQNFTLVNGDGLILHDAVVKHGFKEVSHIFGIIPLNPIELK